MGDMGHVMFESPGLHTGGNTVCCCQVKGAAIVDAIEESCEGFGVKILVHLFTVKHEFSEIVRRTAFRSDKRKGLLSERLLHKVKSVKAHNQ